MDFNFNFNLKINLQYKYNEYNLLKKYKRSCWGVLREDTKSVTKTVITATRYCHKYTVISNYIQ